MAWPQTFPPQCPPQDAGSPEGRVVYCFVEQNPPTLPDFRSQRQLNPEREPYKDPEVECKAHGFSVFSELYDLHLLRSAIRKFRKMEPARGELEDALGVIKATPANTRRPNDSHHTLWFKTGTYPENHFQVISVDWSTIEL
ncbi:hypothetical protein GKIL_1423 [Gloeobacter kilaueensis JS1]|uniref:Uncharacterized protein n=1 Tax=Gloeobacter kilaueensis (strain ATCC BAA-2537 / CCAP 1431/1 / ULC 316 / JS1) TaxID=1183438 RepID=U5QJ66_GLOK1|nr:hypothetical protein GKIL_1423 [Gloeobacter kilaueensis JS1]